MIRFWAWPPWCGKVDAGDNVRPALSSVASSSMEVRCVVLLHRLVVLRPAPARAPELRPPAGPRTRVFGTCRAAVMKLYSTQFSALCTPTTASFARWHRLRGVIGCGTWWRARCRRAQLYRPQRAAIGSSSGKLCATSSAARLLRGPRRQVCGGRRLNVHAQPLAEEGAHEPRLVGGALAAHPAPSEWSGSQDRDVVVGAKAAAAADVDPRAGRGSAAVGRRGFPRQTYAVPEAMGGPVAPKPYANPRLGRSSLRIADAFGEKTKACPNLLDSPARHGSDARTGPSGAIVYAGEIEPIGGRRYYAGSRTTA